MEVGTSDPRGPLQLVFPSLCVFFNIPIREIVQTATNNVRGDHQKDTANIIQVCSVSTSKCSWELVNNKNSFLQYPRELGQGQNFILTLVLGAS